MYKLWDNLCLHKKEINKGDVMTTLSAVDSKGKTLPADEVTSLPGIGKVATKQFAGYESITGYYYPKTKTGNAESLFYWFVGAEDYENKPTIIWSNGGPGSSSFWGFFIENGPYQIDSATEPKLSLREHAWNNEANYMIFEHPLSVTLSFAHDESDLPETVEEGIEQYYQALVNFMARHPEIAKNPIILAGESYAGTYLPLLANAILKGNKSKESPNLDLKALVLMDAWVDPYTQMSTDTEYALTHGLISAREKKKLDKQFKHNYPALNAEIQKICGLVMMNTAYKSNSDINLNSVLEYLNRDDVRKALHIESNVKLTESWSAGISNNYQPEVNKSFRKLINKLLDENLQTIVISGLNDAKDCNFLGTSKWLDKLKGKNANAFHNAPTKQWVMAENEPVLGYLQESKKLTWAKILNAGHMAAMDQPQIIKLLKEQIGF